MVDNIGIVDTRNIISAVTDAYGIDLSDYASTILRRRLVHIINTYGCHSAEDLIDKISRGLVQADDFKYELAIETTEIFRDPSLWRELRDKYLPEVCRTPDCRIWLPNVTSGDELYSLSIVMTEANLMGKAQITANCPSDRHAAQIKKGVGYNPKKIEISEANYTRYAGKTQFNSYYNTIDNKAVMKPALLNGVVVEQRTVMQSEANRQYKMVIYRNSLLQYNIPLYDKIIHKLIDSLATGGYLIIGNMETLEYSEANRKMQVVNDSEKIYKKRID